MGVCEIGATLFFLWLARPQVNAEKWNSPISAKGGHLDSGIQLIYTNFDNGNWFVLRIESLEIDDHILDKIESRHGVSLEEVEQACLSEKRHVRRSREGLYKLFSQTAAGRYVLVVLANLGKGTWKIVTARQMTDNERRLYNKVIGG